MKLKELSKEELETIVDGWLILDEGQFDLYPDADKLYVRRIRLSYVSAFTSSKEINDERLHLIGKTENGYRYATNY